ncbi:MAG: hypothetical protein JXO72_11560 [Vicinamibacteria bacterium]|nr:hypothetical protein [Vicinamibacteria bacterium]
MTAIAGAVVTGADLEAAAFRIEPLRRTMAAKRVGLAFSIGATMIYAARRAIVRAPDPSVKGRGKWAAPAFPFDSIDSPS